MLGRWGPVVAARFSPSRRSFSAPARRRFRRRRHRPPSRRRSRPHPRHRPPPRPSRPPRAVGESPRPAADGAKDLAWLAKLDMPDLPVRWDSRVVRYLEFFKDDPRGRATLSTWLRRSGRYRDAIRKVFRKKGLPEDLTW